jgi:Low-density lipoprotein receptor repeat class B
VSGHRPALPHARQGDHQHPLLRQSGITIGIAALLALAALLLMPPRAHGNFVYWSEKSPASAIARAKINGTGLNTRFISGLNNPTSVAVDSQFVYWTDSGTNSVGRANLDGTGVTQNLVTAGVNNPKAIAVAPTGIYWANNDGSIGHANLDGGSPTGTFIPTGGSCGLAADPGFLYFINDGNNRIGRATLNGGSVDPAFISTPPPASIFCDLAVDPRFVYYTSDTGNTIGRGPVSGGTADPSFIAAGTTGGGPTGVAVNSQYIFWANGTTGAVGRANINGGGVNPAFIATAGANDTPDGSQLDAAPSNKITINSITKKKKKGTAAVDAKVPGPGQVTLNQTDTPPDLNAVAAGVKQVGLTITQASSFKLAVKPTGKTAKKLNKQIKKQLRKKRKAKAKANVTVFIHFVPAGIAGVPNTQQVTVTLVKQRTKKKK